MKAIKKVVLLAMSLSIVVSSLIGDESKKLSSKGKLTIDTKTFFYSGDRKNRTDREALAIGGIFKYESTPLYGLKLGVAFYNGYDLLKRGEETAQKGSIKNGGKSNVVTKNIASNTEMVNSDGSSITELGEAYLEYNIKNTMLKVGRQRLNTPLLNDYYNRLLPNSFNAIVLSNKDIPNTKLMAIYSSSWKYKARDEFIGMKDNIKTPDNKPINNDIVMYGIKNTTIPNTKISLYNYQISDIMNSTYFQLDNSKTFSIDSIKLSFSAQYLSQKEAGKKLLGNLDSYLAGAKLGLAKGNAKLTLLYDVVGNHTIRGSGTDYSTMGYSKFVNFTDIQIDGEALNAGAVSYGAVLGYKINRLKPAIKYVRIVQDLNKQSVGKTPNTRPSSNEFNFDVKYKISNISKLRVRLAKIYYESTHKNEFTEANFRVIYDYKFWAKY